MASREELIAANRTVGEIEEHIEADSLGYLSIEAITEALNRSGANLCLGCVTGEYPYDVEGEATDREVTRPTVGRGTSAGD
jgi:amidophosphoribosyltransferase